jgi:hypothetical protein
VDESGLSAQDRLARSRQCLREGDYEAAQRNMENLALMDRL